MASSSAASRAALGGRTAAERPTDRRLALLVGIEAALFFVAALAIIFTQAHPPRFGLMAFGVVTLATAAVRFGIATGDRDGGMRVLGTLEATISIAAGATSCILGLVAATPLALILAVGLWAAVSGLIRVANGLRRRTLRRPAGDAFIVAGCTLLLAVLALLVPPGLALDYGGLERVEGTLTASMQVTGYVGAYCAIVGVLLGIAAASAAGVGPHAPPRPTEADHA